MVGVTTIVSSSFENNVSNNGPAIYAIEGGVMDAGMNCASKNTSSKGGDASVDCDGIEFEDGSCKKFKTCIKTFLVKTMIRKQSKKKTKQCNFWWFLSAQLVSQTKNSFRDTIVLERKLTFQK